MKNEKAFYEMFNDNYIDMLDGNGEKTIGIEEAFNILKPIEKQVLICLYIDKLSKAEMLQKLNMSYTQYYNIHNKAKLKLMKLLPEQIDKLTKNPSINRLTGKRVGLFDHLIRVHLAYRETNNYKNADNQTKLDINIINSLEKDEQCCYLAKKMIENDLSLMQVSEKYSIEKKEVHRLFYTRLKLVDYKLYQKTIGFINNNDKNKVFSIRKL